MTIFLQENNAPSIWNKQSEKIISFVEGEYETDNDFEISLLKKHGYKLKNEPKEKPKVQVKKPGRPKAKKD